jgi:hypothetical protein
MAPKAAAREACALCGCAGSSPWRQQRCGRAGTAHCSPHLCFVLVGKAELVSRSSLHLGSAPWPSCAAAVRSCARGSPRRRLGSPFGRRATTSRATFWGRGST